MTTETPNQACDEFVWHPSTTLRCHTCHLTRDDHVDGWISRRPSDPELTRYLSEPCDEAGCGSVATHNGFGRAKTPCNVCAGCRYSRPCERDEGKRGKFCNSHTDFDKYARARND